VEQSTEIRLQTIQITLDDTPHDAIVTLV